MADVFISYKRAFRAQVQRIAARLERLGVSVWFDQSLEVGEDFRQEIKQELMAARAVIALWSPECFSSKDEGWVRWEAGEARKREVLVPACVGPVALEPPFHLDHMVDLGDWMARAGPDPHYRDTAWREILRRLAGLLDRPALDGLDKALGARADASLKRWAAANPDDPYARKFEARERRGAARRDLILGCDFEIALPQHIHRYPFDRSRFIFFTVETGEREAPAPIRSLAFSADGQSCLVAGGDGVMRIVAVETGDILFEVGDLVDTFNKTLFQFGGPDPNEVSFINCEACYLFRDRFCLFDTNDRWGYQTGLAIYNWPQTRTIFSRVIHEYTSPPRGISLRAVSMVNNKILACFHYHVESNIEDHVFVYDINETGIEELSKLSVHPGSAIYYFAKDLRGGCTILRGLVRTSRSGLSIWPVETF